MKTYFAFLASAFCAASIHHLQAQTLDWGSELGSTLVDSNGSQLDNTFVFEIGAFVDGFMPDANNVELWLSNWRVFDQASYNQSIGYFTKWTSDTDTLRMLDDGTSNSPYMTSGAPSFEGLTAFLWVRKGDDPVEGSEWLLTRADSWVFPAATPGCCDNEAVVQWSVSDLDGSDIPVWGRQSSDDPLDPYVSTGSGVFTNSTYSTLQTFTFVPEPSSMVFAAISLGIVMGRRRRISQ